MKFLKVGYSRTFPLEQFGNEKPFVEIEVGEGESPMDALNEAKKLVHEFHQQTLAELEAKSTIQVAKPQANKLTAFDEIKKCTTIEELKQWELFASSTKDNAIKDAYCEQLKKIKK